MYKGDYLDIMNNIPNGSIDMILCDLPYGTTRNKWDCMILLDVLWEHYNRIIKDNGVIALFAQTPFDKVLGSSNLKTLKYEWIWEKTQPTGHLNAKKMPMKCHENILIFYKKLPTYNPQKTTGHRRKISKAEHKINSKKTSNWGDYGLTTYNSTDRYPRDVLVFPKDVQKSALHPTQKPVALLEYLIKTYTNENEVVLDNTMGSGSTGIACLKTNRKFIGIEKDEKFFEIANNRINKYMCELTKS